MSYFMQHVLFALFSFGVGLFFFFTAQSMPASARLFPQSVAALIFLLSFVMAFNARRSAPPSGEKARINAVRVVTYSLMIAAYIAVTEKAGYFVTTPLFMIISYIYLRAAGLLKAILIAALFCGFIYLLFVRFLNLPVPLGLLEPLLGA